MKKKTRKSSSEIPTGLRRVSLIDLKTELNLTKEPIVVTVAGNPMGIIYPYDAALEEELLKKKKQYKAGDINYQQFREELVVQGYQALIDRKVIVRPQDVIAAESLEETKRKNSIEGANMLLMGAKFWGSRNEVHICARCSYEMIPKSIAEAEGVIAQVTDDLTNALLNNNGKSNDTYQRNS